MARRRIDMRYEVLRTLGSGASGSTYLVDDESSGRKLALKSLLKIDIKSEIFESFLKECALLHRLSHPNISCVIEYGEDKGQPYFTTEYVEGDDFVAACRNRDWNAVFDLIVQLCWALDYIHSKEIVHRDLKPANILVGKVHDESQSLERLRLKLIDFGLAITDTKRREDEAEHAGTLGYMAPEIMGQRPYDQRADLYSLGIVLYEMALGRLPVAKTESFSEYLAALHRHQVDMEPLRASDEIPGGIVTLIERLLVENPEQRLQSARAAIQLLNEQEHEDFPFEAPEPKPIATKRKPVQLHIAGTESPSEVLETLLNLVRSGKQQAARSYMAGTREVMQAERDRSLVEQYYAAAGHVLIEQGAFDEAQELIDEMSEHQALRGIDSIDKCLLEIQLFYRQGMLKQAQEELVTLTPERTRETSLELKTRIESYWGLVMQGLKKYDEAASHFEQAAQYASECDRKDQEPGLLMNAGTLYYDQGQWSQAYDVFCRAEALAREQKNVSLLASILSNLGNLYLYFGRPRLAEKSLEESLDIAQEQGLQSIVSYDLFLLATGEVGKGNAEKVEDYLEQALDVSKELGASQSRFHAELAQGYFYLLQERQEDLTATIKTLRQYCKETGQEAYELQVNWLEAKLLLQQARITKKPIRKWLKQLKQDAEHRQLQNNLWQILSDQGKLAQLRDDTEAAQKAYQEALLVIDELKAAVPPSFRDSFLRDRKKEAIRKALEGLTPGAIPKELPSDSSDFSFEQWSEINRRLLLQHNIDSLLEEILDSALALTDAERGFVILSDEQELDIRTARNFDKESLNPKAEEFSYTIAQEVMRKGESLVSLDAGADERFAEAKSVHALEIRSVLSVPLRAGDRTIGLIYLDNRYRPGAMQKKHIRLIEVLADQASLSLEHARLHRENRERIALIEELNAHLEADLNETTNNLEALREGMKREHDEIRLRYSYDQMIGKSDGIKKMLTTLDRFVDTNQPVFIRGESGTGKELVARACHYNSPRQAMTFVAENCAALSDHLLESELFGHVKGAFTGADRDKIGLFQMAHRGTLFLDEVGDMSLAMQAKLLRVLQEGEVRRVGGRDYHKVDVRVITASHKDIRKMVEDKSFRQDLYYRLNVIRIDLPPLRERGEDVLLLADHFLSQFAAAEGKRKPRFNKAATRILLDYSWPGNVRELQNEMQRLIILDADVISPSLLSPSIVEGLQAGTPMLQQGGLGGIIEGIEKKAILEAMERCRGNKVKAAQLLQIGRRTLYMKLKEYDISPHWGKDAVGAE